jgi:hypothetical protein
MGKQRQTEEESIMKTHYAGTATLDHVRLEGVRLSSHGVRVAVPTDV